MQNNYHDYIYIYIYKVIMFISSKTCQTPRTRCNTYDRALSKSFFFFPFPLTAWICALLIFGLNILNLPPRNCLNCPGFLFQVKISYADINIIFLFRFYFSYFLVLRLFLLVFENNNYPCFSFFFFCTKSHVYSFNLFQVVSH
jgi:hypothetical protein